MLDFEGMNESAALTMTRTNIGNFMFKDSKLSTHTFLGFDVGVCGG